MHINCSREEVGVWRVRLSPTEGTETMLDPAGVEQLLAIAAEAEEGCRALVLEGQPGMFCQGMDLGFIAAHSGEDQGEGVRAFARSLAVLRASPAVVIAAVDGVANGGGVGLAACADIVIATSRSTFGLPELVLGLIPAVVMPILLQRLPPQQARLLALSSAVDAARAHELGLVDRLVAEPEDLERAIRREIKQVLRLCPEAVAEIKALGEALEGRSCAEGLELGARRIHEILAEEGRMGPLRGFLAGEPLPWFARYRPKERS